MAKVVDNNDPLKLERVKFRIQGLHRNTTDANLPWAIPQKQSIQGNNNVGSINIPSLGSEIIVYFIDDYSVIYTGVMVRDDNTIDELTSTNYPNCYGHIDASGNKMLVDTTANTVTFTHVSGTQIQIAQNGTTTIVSKGDINLNSQNNINLVTTNNIALSCKNFSVDASSAITLKSNTITSDGSSININSNSTTLSSSGSVTLDASSFTLAAGFNLIPVNGWISPPSPSPGPTPPSPSPVTPITPIPRTRPTITPFVNQVNY